MQGTLLSLEMTCFILQTSIYDYFLLPQMFDRLFPHVIIDWIVKNVPVINGGQMGKCTYKIGVLASRHVRTTGGGGGQMFAILMRTY